MGLNGAAVTAGTVRLRADCVEATVRRFYLRSFGHTSLLFLIFQSPTAKPTRHQLHTVYVLQQK